MEKKVTTTTTAPRRWKMVSVQKRRNIAHPAVVAALPKAAPPRARREAIT